MPAFVIWKKRWRIGIEIDANQKYTPKYWVCHHPELDDVMLETADKNMHDSVRKFIRIKDYRPEDIGYVCELVEIKLVNIN